MHTIVGNPHTAGMRLRVDKSMRMCILEMSEGGNMKIVRNGEVCGARKTLNEIPMGTVFTGAIGSLDSVFVKSYVGIISLENSMNTWDKASTCVTNYKEQNAELHICGKGS